jgi:hypothetical protein
MRFEALIRSRFPPKPLAKRKTQTAARSRCGLVTVFANRCRAWRRRDPGVGGGRHGTFEKEVTLAIARKLKAQIDAEPNMRAVLTRDG